jgi:hypothetical protein
MQESIDNEMTIEDVIGNEIQPCNCAYCIMKRNANASQQYAQQQAIKQIADKW